MYRERERKLIFRLTLEKRMGFFGALATSEREDFAREKLHLGITRYKERYKVASEKVSRSTRYHSRKLAKRNLCTYDTRPLQHCIRSTADLWLREQRKLQRSSCRVRPREKRARDSYSRHISGFKSTGLANYRAARFPASNSSISSTG